MRVIGLDEIVSAARAGVPGLDGNPEASWWVGRTDQEFQLTVARRDPPYFTMAWSYHTFDKAANRFQGRREIRTASDLEQAVRECAAGAKVAVHPNAQVGIRLEGAAAPKAGGAVVAAGLDRDTPAKKLLEEALRRKRKP